MECAVAECQRPSVARGWCLKHYKRWRRHGDPVGGVNRYASPHEAFAANTQRREDGCIVWTAGKHVGYGRIAIGYKQIPAHVYAWQQAHGPVPDGYVIDHKCFERACVNVEHLRLATRSQNSSHLQGAKSHNRTTGYRNVYRHGPYFRVTITKGGKAHSFGLHRELADAVAAAERGRRELFAEYAGGGH